MSALSIARLRRAGALLLWGLLFAAAGCDDTNADLIVYGDWVLPMDSAGSEIQDGAVVLAGDTIVAIGTRASIDARWRAPRTIDGTNRVVLPGLINGHTHAAMTLLRGVADDLELMEWLGDYIFPLEGSLVSPDFVRVGTQLACLEMIRGGTTTFVDMYFHPDEAAQVVEQCGLRALMAPSSIDLPSPGFEGWADAFASSVDFAERWRDRHPRITPVLAPHAPYTVSPEHLREVVAEARRLGVRVTTHLAESASETADIASRYGGATPVEHVAGQGLFEVPLIAAHMVHLTPSDIARVAEAGVGVIHNPTSNLKLASGISPVPALLEAGVAVGLGTDGAASNNDLDLWSEMNLAALIHKAQTGDPTAVPSRAALEMATRLGARALGMDDRIGHLAPGMQADLIQVDVSRTDAMPVYDIVSHLVYLLDAADVTTTIVAGQVLMQDRRILSLDQNQLRADARGIAAQVRAQVDDSVAR